MTQLQLPMDTETLIQNRFSEARIEIQSIERKDYPEESTFVVYVTEDDFASATIIGNSLDPELTRTGFNGFVVVRKLEREAKNAVTRLKDGVQNLKATNLPAF